MATQSVPFRAVDGDEDGIEKVIEVAEDIAEDILDDGVINDSNN